VRYLASQQVSDKTVCIHLTFYLIDGRMVLFPYSIPMSTPEHGVKNVPTSPEKRSFFQRTVDFIRGITKGSTQAVLDQADSVWYEATDPTGAVVSIRSKQDEAYLSAARANDMSFAESKQRHEELWESLPPLYEATDPLGNPLAIKSAADSQYLLEAHQIGCSFQEVKDHYTSGSPLPSPSPEYQNSKPTIPDAEHTLIEFQTAFDPKGNMVTLRSSKDLTYLEEAIALGQDFEWIKNYHEGRAVQPEADPTLQGKDFWYVIPDPNGTLTPIRSQKDRTMMSEAFVLGYSFDVVKAHHDQYSQ